MAKPCRGEVWTVNLEPVKGHEQGERRPALVLSVDQFNHGPAELVIVLPITRTKRNIPLHVQVMTGDGGLQSPSSILCDQIRCISTERLGERWGAISEAVLAEVEDRVMTVLGLP